MTEQTLTPDPGDATVVDEDRIRAQVVALGRRYRRAQDKVAEIRNEIKTLAPAAVASGMSEIELWKLSGVDRITLRAALGKPRRPQVRLRSLTGAEEAAVVHAYEAGTTDEAELARKFGCTRETIANVLRRRETYETVDLPADEAAE